MLFVNEEYTHSVHKEHARYKLDCPIIQRDHAGACPSNCNHCMPSKKGPCRPHFGPARIHVTPRYPSKGPRRLHVGLASVCVAPPET